MRTSEILRNTPEHDKRKSYKREKINERSKSIKKYIYRNKFGSWTPLRKCGSSRGSRRHRIFAYFENKNHVSSSFALCKHFSFISKCTVDFSFIIIIIPFLENRISYSIIMCTRRVYTRYSCTDSYTQNVM